MWGFFLSGMFKRDFLRLREAAQFPLPKQFLASSFPLSGKPTQGSGLKPGPGGVETLRVPFRSASSSGDLFACGVSSKVQGRLLITTGENLYYHHSEQ